MKNINAIKYNICNIFLLLIEMLNYFRMQFLDLNKIFRKIIFFEKRFFLYFFLCTKLRIINNILEIKNFQ